MCVCRVCAMPSLSVCDCVCAVCVVRVCCMCAICVVCVVSHVVCANSGQSVHIRSPLGGKCLGCGRGAGDTHFRIWKGVLPQPFLPVLEQSTEEIAPFSYDGKTERGDANVLHMGMCLSRYSLYFYTAVGSWRHYTLESDLAPFTSHQECLGWLRTNAAFLEWMGNFFKATYPELAAEYVKVRCFEECCLHSNRPPQVAERHAREPFKEFFSVWASLAINFNIACAGA